MFHIGYARDEENSRFKFVIEIDWAYGNSICTMHYDSKNVTSDSTSQSDVICQQFFTFWDQFNEFLIEGSP